MNISLLPDCVLENIFDKCTFRSRLNLSHSCRQLYDYFDPDAIWRLALVQIKIDVDALFFDFQTCLLIW